MYPKIKKLFTSVNSSIAKDNSSFGCDLNTFFANLLTLGEAYLSPGWGELSNKLSEVFPSKSMVLDGFFIFSFGGINYSMSLTDQEHLIKFVLPFTHWCNFNERMGVNW